MLRPQIHNQMIKNQKFMTKYKEETTRQEIMIKIRIITKIRKTTVRNNSNHRILRTIELSADSILENRGMISKIIKSLNRITVEKGEINHNNSRKIKEEEEKIINKIEIMNQNYLKK